MGEVGETDKEVDAEGVIVNLNSEDGEGKQEGTVLGALQDANGS